jgi:hypothetical protein
MTTATAEYKSVLSMPLNTSLLSAAFPSGPVIRVGLVGRRR